MNPHPALLAQSALAVLLVKAVLSISFCGFCRNQAKAILPMFGAALCQLHPVSPGAHMFFFSGSNDAWRQHPWLKAKHNIRYMCARVLHPPFPALIQFTHITRQVSWAWNGGGNLQRLFGRGALL
jgi:hypothetical protein